MKPLITHLSTTVPTDSTAIPYWMIYAAAIIPVTLIAITIVLQRKQG